MWNKDDDSIYSVIIADDEAELRRGLIQRVDWKSAGFKVIGEADNGADAVNLVESLHPDLVIADIRMPFVSGIEMARQIREIRPATQIAFLSAYDDFSYAQQAIQYNVIAYLLKPISAAEMLVELQKINEKMDEQFRIFSLGTERTDKMELSEFLMPLILDGCAGDLAVCKREHLWAEAIRLGLQKKEKEEIRYLVLVTSIYTLEKENHTTPASVGAVDLILRKYVKHASFYVFGRVVSLLIATAGAFDRYLHVLAEDIVQSIQRILNCDAVIGCSREISTLSGLHEAYLEAMNAMVYSRHGGQSVNYITDLETGDAINLEIIHSYIGELESTIRGGSKQDLERLLDDFFHHMEAQFISRSAGALLLSELNTMVVRLVYAVTGQEGVLEMQKLVPMVHHNFLNTQELRRCYLKFCQTAREMILEQRKKSSQVLCERALEIIQTRYMNPELTLALISKEIAVSPNYLSALIKKTTGETFVDLLTERRMEHAKNLLQGSIVKVREIAEQCGYHDQHYFSYCFKKYTGMSPLAFRQSAQKWK